MEDSKEGKHSVIIFLKYRKRIFNGFSLIGNIILDFQTSDCHGKTG